MDRNYYYRILGLTEGATTKQIQQAYESRIAKLNSDDYRDDPFYVEKKKRQATEAYRVLTGSAPPVSSAQRRARFEKLKDHIEQKESGGRMSSDTGDGFESSKPKKSPVSQFSQGSNRKKYTAVIIAVVIIIIAAVGVAVTLVVNNVADSINKGVHSGEWSWNWDYGSDDTDDIYEQDAIDAAADLGASLDYYSNLDMSTINANADDIQWTYGIGEYGGSEEDGTDDVFSSTFNLMYSLDISDMTDFYYYISGDKDFFVNNDDYACAAMLIAHLGAPPFESIAGSTNLYTGEPILNIADYLDYLWYVVNEQS